MTELLDFFDNARSEELNVLTKVFDHVELEVQEGLKPEPIRDVVPIKDWITSKYYLGPLAASLYPYWRDHIVDFFEGSYNELILTGALGTGKSTMALVACIRKVYELSCYNFPQRMFGLADISKIFFAYLSVSRTQAEMTGFGDIRLMFDATPYFQENFFRDEAIDSVLRFPQNIYFIPGSDALHVIGTNLLAAILDEANFMKDGPGGKAGNLQKATNLYQEVTNRRRNRFLKNGFDPGFSILVSSTTHQSSFTEERIKKADESVKIVTSAPWDVKPQNYSNERFAVFIGTDVDDPRIIMHPEDLYPVIREEEELEEVQVEAQINSGLEGDDLLSKLYPVLSKDSLSSLVFVPEDFRTDFQKDLYACLKNVAGVSIVPAGKLFSSKSVWRLCIKNELRHPFKKMAFCVSLNQLHEVYDFFDEDYFFDFLDGGTVLRPKRHPHERRYVHIDQSITGDTTGVAMVHQAGYVTDRDTGMKQPLIEVDFVLRIFPPQKPDKISIGKIRKFIFDLRARGVKFGAVSYDQYQSEDSLQIMQTQNINTLRVSVDKDDKPWLDMVNLLQERRVHMYNYPLLETEFFALDHDRIKHKVDHPVDGSKDIADALVGAVHTCLEGFSKIPVGNFHRAGDLQVRRGLKEAYEPLWHMPGYGISRSGVIRKLE